MQRCSVRELVFAICIVGVVTDKELSDESAPVGIGEPRERSSIVDVFENYFGENIDRLASESMRKLPTGQAEELVYEADKYLESVQGSFIPTEAVVLDSLTNPILIPEDQSEPTTTLKAKQVALYHREVVIPIQPLAMDFEAMHMMIVNENDICVDKHRGVILWTR